MPANAITHLRVIRVTDNESAKATDALAVEEPLEIRLEYGPAEGRKVQNISVTMRTPGNDAELALGFLFTEGIIKEQTEINSIEIGLINRAQNKENVILVSLKQRIIPNLANTERNFYTTSSCGVCAKASISAIRTVSAYNNNNNNNEPVENQINADVLCKLPFILKGHQKIFADTGGLHASALFNSTGELLLLREDVGRHNALDKLIGAALNKSMLPLNHHILLLSGRASFELVQKAVMAGITMIAAVGAPSSLAVQLAEEFNVTLIGFLRDQRFNIYTQSTRISLHQYENTY
ncbi:MAG: fdhD [Mucilaginibacter sp.]|nr:fdhD [Mucilaginibacter sp.]